MLLSISDEFLKSLQIENVSHDYILQLIEIGNSFLLNRTKIEKLLINKPKYNDSIENNEKITAELGDIKTELLRLNMIFGSGTKKGKFAEKIVIKNLHKHFPYAEIDDTGYEFSKGDIIIKYQKWKIMIEVKNYDEKAVNSTEQQKFHRDLTQNNYDAGVLLSCRSGIAHKKNKFMYETINDKLAVYLSNAGSDGYALIWGILFIVASLNLSNEFKNNKEKSELLFVCVRKKLANMEKYVYHIEKTLKTLSDMKTNIIKTLNNNIKNIEFMLNTTKQNITNDIDEFYYLIKNGKLKSDIILLSKFEKIISSNMEDMTCKELKELCKKKEISNYSGKNKKELIDLLNI